MEPSCSVRPTPTSTAASTPTGVLQPSASEPTPAAIMNSDTVAGEMDALVMATALVIGLLSASNASATPSVAAVNREVAAPNVFTTEMPCTSSVAAALVSASAAV